MKVNDNRIDVYLHLVWGTYRKQPLITDDLEPALHACISAQAEGCGCRLLGLNGTCDHIHILLMLPATLTLAHLVKQMKGASAAFANSLSKHGPAFRWQKGYGCFSVSPCHVRMVTTYIARQKLRHAANRLWQSCESSILWTYSEDAASPPL